MKTKIIQMNQILQSISTYVTEEAGWCLVCIVNLLQQIQSGSLRRLQTFYGWCSLVNTSHVGQKCILLQWHDTWPTACSKTGIIQSMQWQHKLLKHCMN